MPRSERFAAWGFLALAFLAALVIRVDGIEIPSLDFHATRQYRAALIAHSLYTGEPQPWEAEVTAMDSIEAGGEMGELELPIGETIAAGLYTLAGGEALWLPRLVCILAWLAGGGFLFALACSIAGAPAATIGTVLYLFLPFAVEASRSFQPDPLMIALLIASWWAMARHFFRPSVGGLLTCGLLAASAVAVKPMALLFLVPSILALSILRRSQHRMFFDRSVWILIACALVPALYYGFQLFAGLPLQAQAERSIVPELLSTREFWRKWLVQIDEVVPLPLVALGLISSAAIRSPFRPFLVSLWIGYLGLGLVFTRNISTHDYYSLPLIPIVGLGLVPAIAWIWEVGRSRLPARGVVISAVLGVLALVTAVGFWHRHWQSVREPALARAASIMEIGTVVGHSANTIFLASDFGKPLIYYAGVSGRLWPKAKARQPGSTAAEIFVERNRDGRADYFIITDLKELKRQPDLAAFLQGRFRLVAEKRRYLVFDLRKEL